MQLLPFQRSFDVMEHGSWETKLNGVLHRETEWTFFRHPIAGYTHVILPKFSVCIFDTCERAEPIRPNIDPTEWFTLTMNSDERVNEAPL